MPIKLTTYYKGKDIPDLPGKNTFHSKELFQIYEATPGYTPLLIIATENGKPVARLLAAIRKAKTELDIDMDSAVSLNTTRQSIARTFKRMNDLRSSEQTISNGGTGYRFNAEGNQISYRCDVRRVTTINYDRKVIRAALGKLNQQADETSARIDLCLVTSKVDYAPPFDVNASFAEAFEIYTENAGA